MASLGRRVAAEALGTCLLVATVVGSGIMAQALTGDGAVALLGNTLPTGAILVVLITILSPISGAHLNPIISMVFVLRRELPAHEGFLYALVQFAGGIAGTLLAHAMFGYPILELPTKARAGAGLWLSEGVATFGLVIVILAGLRLRRTAVPWLVGLYIGAAYWFTASTSFANPAATVARALTNSFSGLRPLDAPAFVVAQLVGALCGLAAATWLLESTGDSAR